MKTKITLIGVLIIGLVGTSNIAFASEKKIQKETAAAQTAEIQAQEIEVRGVVEKSKSGLSLFDGNNTYALEGNKNLKGMIGKLAKINGTLKKDETGATIVVKQAVAAN